MATNAERFGRLFRGYELRHGRYDVQEETDSGKMVGHARTLDRAIAGEDYAAHIAGEYGIGVIPLTEQNTVHFAAIDIDDYNTRSPEYYADRTENLPAVVTRSKSGGTHVWIFSDEGLDAVLAVKLLKQWAADLGVAGSEIFPKQVKRSSDKDIGNWINLPYFNSGRRALLHRFKDSRKEATEIFDASLDEFLTYAEDVAQKLNNETIKKLLTTEKSQRNRTDGTTIADWEDGPYCLQRLFVGIPKAKDETLHAPALAEGGRNTAFFNAAVYLSRKYPGNAEHIVSILNEVNVRYQLGFPIKEIQTCVNSALKKDWGFQCKQPPLAPVCNRAVCLKRRFGIGSRGEDTSVDISDLVKVKTDPPLYILNADGERIEVDGDVLLNQRAFTRAIMDATSKTLPVMQEQKYRDLIQLLLDKSTTIEGPPGTDLETTIRGELAAFIDRSLTPHKDRLKSASMLVWVDEEEEWAWFHRSDFTKWLNNQRINIDSRRVSIMLEQIGCIHRPTTIAGKSVRPWRAPYKDLMGIGEK